MFAHSFNHSFTLRLSPLTNSVYLNNRSHFSYKHWTNMDFDQLIVDYKENSSEISSPIWIWFKKMEKKDVMCQICKTNIQHRDHSTNFVKMQKRMFIADI